MSTASSLVIVNVCREAIDITIGQSGSTKSMSVCAVKRRMSVTTADPADDAEAVVPRVVGIAPPLTEGLRRPLQRKDIAS